MGRRARFGGRSSGRGSGGSGGRPSGRYNRERYAAGGAHFSIPTSSSSDALELHQEFEKLYKNDFQCRFYYRQLLKDMADAVAVGGECFYCEDTKEKMKDCPGVEKLKFKNEGAPTQEELNKLTDQEFECRKFTEISKRDARNAEWFGLENNADHYTRILANLRCDDLKKEGGRWWSWWW